MTSPFVASDVAFRPREFTTTITNDWTTVPHCTTDFNDYGNTATDHLSRVHTAANIAMGIGDICRYMGVVDGSSWRMPTAAEIAKLYGSDQKDKGQSVKLGDGWVLGNYYPLSGYAMGPNRNSVKIIGIGTDARVTNADPNTNGAAFVPASGHRNYVTGAIYDIGAGGYYWSATAVDAGGGYHMSFSSTIVWPQQVNPHTNALPVRCIRE